MQTQFILRMVLAVLTLKYSYIEARTQRGNFHHRYETNEQDSLTFNNENLFEILKKAGLTVDEDSEIIIHEEDNYVNLTCFDCIIINLPKDYMGASSFNEDRPGQ